jgi:hypothetical protein
MIGSRRRRTFTCLEDLMRSTILATSAVALGLLACAEPTIAPAPEAAASVASLRSGHDNAAVHWNEIARTVVARNGSSAPVAIRAYAVMSIAQHNAAVAAKEKSVPAAIAAASMAALSYVYPAESETLESLLREYLGRISKPGSRHWDVIGVEIGLRKAIEVVTYAQGDRFFAPWTGTVPVGPGKWFSATPPGGAMFGQAKTYFLETGSQFRPPPHPAFGSPAFQTALAEVRQISDTRTAEQDSLAKFWNLPAGTYQPPGYWNEEAARLIKRYRVNERRSAHLFALINAVSYDAIVASHEAKYHYWLLRPTMADPGIVLPIGLPNFPSYPSNHAAISAGMATILGDAFHRERGRLDALAVQAALSRVYGGIHYRFDGDAGVELGKRIAAWTLANDRGVHKPFVLD